MKEISLKASGRPQLPQILAGIGSLIARHRVSMAVISGIICLIGTLAGSDPAMFAGAFAAMGAIRPLSQEGGAE